VLSVPVSLRAAEKGAPPKPQNVLSPDEALDRLMKGNRRYVNGNMHRHDFIAERPALTLARIFHHRGEKVAKSFI
jgi:carbonic anhydrase